MFETILYFVREMLETAKVISIAIGSEVRIYLIAVIHGVNWEFDVSNVGIHTEREFPLEIPETDPGIIP